MSNPKTITMDDGTLFECHPAGTVEALQAQLDAQETPPAGETPPPEGYVHNNFPGLYLRGGYYRFECKTNARNYFWFNAPEKTPDLRASVHSLALLFADPDGAGPEKPAVALTYVTTDGEVIAEGLAGRIQFPDVAPGRYALCITVRYSRSNPDQVVTLYPA